MAKIETYPAILNSAISTSDQIIVVDASGPNTTKNMTFTELDKRYVVTSGNSTVTGIISATSFVGDGSGLTGIASGTGGVINTGSTTIGADSDSDGVGVIALQTRGVTRLQVENLGQIVVSSDIISTSNKDLLTFKAGQGLNAQNAVKWNDNTGDTGQIDVRFDGTYTNIVFGHLYDSGYQTSDILKIGGDKIVTLTSSVNQYGYIHSDGTREIGTYLSNTDGGLIGTKSNHDLGFFTNNSSATMVLTTAGNLGIGNTPGSNLPIGWKNDSKSNLVEISSTVAGADEDAGLLLRRGDTGLSGLDIWFDGSAFHTYIDSRYDNDAGNIYIRTKTLGTPINAVTILGSGNVIVGGGSELGLFTIDKLVASGGLKSFIRNQGTGTGAFAQLALGNANANEVGSLYVLGSNYTTSNQYQQDAVLLESARQNLVLSANTSGKRIDFWVNAINSAFIDNNGINASRFKSSGSTDSIGAGATATINVVVAKGTYLVTATQGTENYSVTGIVHVPEGSSTAEYFEIGKTNANLTLSVSGLNLQATNGTAGSRDVKHTLIKLLID